MNARIGINVRSTKTARYAIEIARGNKTLETRDTDSLRCYVGHRVGLIETGRGKARLVGYATIGAPVELAYCDFETRESDHLVKTGDPFYPKPGESKYCYPMVNATECEHREISTRGILARSLRPNE